jgi:hypothetical protein
MSLIRLGVSPFGLLHFDVAMPPSIVQGTPELNSAMPRSPRPGHNVDAFRLPQPIVKSYRQTSWELD